MQRAAVRFDLHSFACRERKVSVCRGKTERNMRSYLWRSGRNGSYYAVHFRVAFGKKTERRPAFSKMENLFSGTCGISDGCAPTDNDIQIKGEVERGRHDQSISFRCILSDGEAHYVADIGDCSHISSAGGAPSC